MQSKVFNRSDFVKCASPPSRNKIVSRQLVSMFLHAEEIRCKVKSSLDQTLINVQVFHLAIK